MQLSFIGPVPVKQFFRKFLPTPLSFPKAKRDRLVGFETVSVDGSESQMYDEFVTVVNSICTGVKAYNNTSKNLPTEGDAKCGPRIILCDASELPPGALLPSFQRMEMFVELESEFTFDPFDGDDSAFQRSFHPICTSPGRIVLHSTRLQMYQFRTLVFSVGVFGDVARLFRWDRSGAIVSGPILYREKGNRELSEFFYRFDLADRAERGWDSTVSDATSEETAAFDQAIKTSAGEGKNKSFKGLLGSVGNDVKYSRRKVYVPHPSGGQTSYIVGRSAVTPKHPAGRCTRGFVAMEVETRKLVFLKDCWRQNTPGVKTESHWYKILQGARNIAAFSHGSDIGRVAPRRGVTTRGMKREIRPHSTLTQNYAERYCEIEPMTGYVHYRTVQCEFYVPLHAFRDSRHLTEIMHDILLAIEDLFERGILHRDISYGNVMITIDGRGCLIDFDFAREVNYSGSHQTSRAGTWRFMSTQLLSTPGKIHELSDDLESHFFVTLYTALHFVKHDKPSGLSTKLIFDQVAVSENTGTRRGGVGKRSMYGEGLKVKFASEPITVLVHRLLSLFRSLRDYNEYMNWEDDPPQSVIEEAEKLEDCTEIKKLFAEALESDGWPTDCDKVEDQYPTSCSTSQQVESIGLSYVDCDATAESSNGKRKRQEDAPHRHPQQRRKENRPTYETPW